MCMSKQCYTDFIDAKVLNRVILQWCAKVLSHPLISLNFARKIGKQVQQFTETCKDIWEYSIYICSVKVTPWQRLSGGQPIDW